ncbi:MAG: sulfite exporter TauE/SafE family protein [Mariprofundales bacterium]|nr:sulfite exporter TauE/SafE family protein [Mariprofundales bacterium]
MDLLLAAASTALVLGLSFGASACMLSCVPTLGVALLSEQGGSHATMRLAARFNAGRWLGYSLLGVVSSAIGASITQGINSRHAGWVFGALLVFSGLMLWRRSARFACSHHGKKQNAIFKGSMFGMGLGMSITPCVPLAAVCASAATSGSIWAGWLLGASFGLGAVIPAQLALGYGLGAANRQIRMQLTMQAERLGRIAGSAIVMMGAAVMGGVLQL